MQDFNDQLLSTKKLKYISSLVQDSHLAIVGTDLEGNIQSWNQKAEKLFGYSYDYIIGKNLSLIIPEKLVQTYIAQVLDRKESGKHPGHIWSYQGELLDIAIFISPIKDENQAIIGLSFFMHDVDMAKKIETGFSFFPKLLETVKDSIIVAKPDGEIVFWNHGSSLLFGWKSDDMLGKNITLLFDPDDTAEVINGIKSGVFEGQSRILTAAGQKKYIRISVNPIYDILKHPRYLAFVISDISEIVEARLEAEKAVRSKSEFLANISHEIRTPMSGILGFAELLYSQDLNNSQKEYLLAIKHHGEQLLELINDILDLSKIEADRMLLENVSFNIKELLELSCSIFRLSIADKGLQLNVEIEPEVPLTLFGDSKHISQVLNNLLSNAVKFTPSGEIAIHVSKGILSDCPENLFPLRIEVIDTGIGIAAEKMDMIFEPFTQADSSTTRKYGGTGLGLAISKRLVNLMGGFIHVESKVNKGSKFMFTIPAARFIDQKEKKSGIKMPSKAKIHKIVLVSADNNLKAIINGHLTDSIFSLVQIENTQKILSIISFYHPLAVILDIASLQEGLTAILQNLEDYCHRTNIKLIIYVKGAGHAAERYISIFKSLDKSLSAEELLLRIDALSQSIIEPDSKKKKKYILIIARNRINQKVLKRILLNKEYGVTVATNSRQAKSLLEDDLIHLIFVEMDLLAQEGYDLIDWTLSQDLFQGIPIIGLRADSSEFFTGISDYLTKPLKSNDIFSIINKYGL